MRGFAGGQCHAHIVLVDEGGILPAGETALEKSSVLDALNPAREELVVALLMEIQPQLIPDFLTQRLYVFVRLQDVNPSRSTFLVEVVRQNTLRAFRRFLSPQMGVNLHQGFVASFASASQPQRLLVEVAQFVRHGPAGVPSAVFQHILVEHVVAVEIAPFHAPVGGIGVDGGICVDDGHGGTIIAVVEARGHGSFLCFEGEILHLHAPHGRGHRLQAVEVAAIDVAFRPDVEVFVLEHILLEPLPVFVGVAADDVERAVAGSADDVDFDVGEGRERFFGVRVLIGDEQFTIFAGHEDVAALAQLCLWAFLLRADGHFHPEFAVGLDGFVHEQIDQFSSFRPDAGGLRESSEIAKSELAAPHAGCGIDFVVVDAEVFLIAAPSGVGSPSVVFHAHGLLAHHRRHAVHRLAQFVVAHRGVFAFELRAGVVCEEFDVFTAYVAVERLLPVFGVGQVLVRHFHFPQQPLRGGRASLPAHNRVVLVGGTGGMQRLVFVLVVYGGEPKHRVLARLRRARVEIGGVGAHFPLLALSGPAYNRLARGQILELVASVIPRNLPDLGVVGIVVFVQVGRSGEVDSAVGVGGHRFPVVGIADEAVVFAAGDAADVVGQVASAIHDLPFRVVALRLVGIDIFAAARGAVFGGEIALLRRDIDVVTAGIGELPGGCTRVRRVPFRKLRGNAQRLVGAALCKHVAAVALGDGEQRALVVERRGVHGVGFVVTVVQEQEAARTHVHQLVAFFRTELRQSHRLLNLYHHGKQHGVGENHHSFHRCTFVFSLNIVILFLHKSATKLQRLF